MRNSFDLSGLTTDNNYYKSLITARHNKKKHCVIAIDSIFLEFQKAAEELNRNMNCIQNSEWILREGQSIEIIGKIYFFREALASSKQTSADPMTNSIPGSLPLRLQKPISKTNRSIKNQPRSCFHLLLIINDRW